MIDVLNVITQFAIYGCIVLLMRRIQRLEARVRELEGVVQP